MSQGNHEDKPENSLFLNNPHTEKELEHGHSFAFAGMQGWRQSNEDFHKHLVPIDQQSWKLWSYFAIFDGHNGVDTAKNAANLLDKHLIDALNEITKNSSDECIHSSELDLNKVIHIIKHTLLQLDKELAGLVKDQSGSVCIASLIGPENIYLINVGDSRAIIISDDGHILEFTKDHKPNVQKEKERICKAGGRVTEYEDDVARVEDQLAVSRALGDYAIDKHLIPASPDIIQCQKSPKSKAAYIILACDGIWDVMSNEEVAQFLIKRISNTSLQDIASQLLDHCLKLETMDNMSIYIVKL
ncbi:unnamed protein product [Adineta steineri]|uniref:PPM-type phosphatase domain-containing protein n=1 Tax=Adineta steineri TaxID=433720 RepID=A0A818GCV2_9BILA|nr:unnamed protein product [Adineta steineri]CAF3487466.1 unnamed protein product [Adineta steineri]CAF3821528.1 unnamed protein product [Adineta steineri]